MGAGAAYFSDYSFVVVNESLGKGGLGSLLDSRANS